MIDVDNPKAFEESQEHEWKIPECPVCKSASQLNFNKHPLQVGFWIKCLNEDCFTEGNIWKSAPDAIKRWKRKI